MRGVEPKLAEWHRLYKELETPRAQLHAARSRSPTDTRPGDLEAETIRLQQRSHQALEAVQSAIAQAKPR